MHDWKRMIWTHACQNRFVQNNGVELIMTKFRLANPCPNKESKQKKMTKDTKEMLMNVFSTRPFILKRGRPC